jgi:hypothetical protein
MFDRKRREFVKLLGGAVVAWPFMARAQQMPLAIVERPSFGVVLRLGGSSATTRFRYWNKPPSFMRARSINRQPGVLQPTKFELQSRKLRLAKWDA